MTKLIHQIPIGLPDGAGALPLTTHQTGTLQLAQLTTDMRLGKPGGIDQGGHIRRPLLELAEQLQPRWLAQQPKELAVLLQELEGGQRARGTHGNGLCR